MSWWAVAAHPPHAMERSAWRPPPGSDRGSTEPASASDLAPDAEDASESVAARRRNAGRDQREDDRDDNIVETEPDETRREVPSPDPAAAEIRRRR